MTIRHLQIFTAVCDCESITAAAQRLNMTQPSVSIAIKELESYYGVRLFDRLNRRIYLTDSGAVLRTYADNLLGQFDESAQVLRGNGAHIKCAVGVNASAAETFFADKAAQIRRSCPQLELSVTVQNSGQLDGLLAENKIDLAVFDGIAQRGSRTSVPVFEDEMTAVCAPFFYPGNKISISELSGKPLLLREKGSGLRSCAEAEFMRHGCKVRCVAESISTLGLLRFAESGMGFALIPRSLSTSGAAGRLKCVDVTDARFRRNYYLVYNSKKHLTQGMKTVIPFFSSAYISK